MLPLVSNHMEDNVEVIHFHIKGRGVQTLVFVQITSEKCTTTFCFSNLQPLLVWHVSAFSRQVRRISLKLLNVSESSINIKVTSYWTLFKIQFTSAVICKQNFCMKTRLCYIFKTSNAITWVNAFQEVPIKFHKVYEKELFLNDPYNVQKGVRTLLTFKFSQLLPYVD